MSTSPVAAEPPTEAPTPGVPPLNWDQVGDEEEVDLSGYSDFEAEIKEEKQKKVEPEKKKIAKKTQTKAIC